MPGPKKLLVFLFGAMALLVAAGGSLRGKLTLDQNGRPVLETAPGQIVILESDRDTAKVLADSRLHGSDFEVVGEHAAPDRFRVGPIHLKSMWVHRNGERFFITYWCELCAIRTYTPGLCQCCQKETELDLKKPGQF